MSKLRIAINGARGRMGQEIMELLKSSSDFYLCATLDNKISEKNYETFVRPQELLQKNPQVIIDFSSPKGSVAMAEWAAKNRVPILIGTTGFSASEIKKINAASKKVAILKSANLSLGVNVLVQAMQMFEKKFGSAEIQIEEIHHKHKKDKPSGTALFIKNELEKTGALKISEPLSLRGGEVFGIHKVYFFGQNEWVCFEHQAQNRKVFAQGALTVSKWLAKKKPGLYGMKEFLSEV